MKWMVILVLCCPPALFAQRENVWVLGAFGLDFNTIPPTKVLMNAVGFNEASAAVSDINGQLVLYTDGDKAWNSQHNMLSGGFALGGGHLTYSTTQGAMIAPVPEQSDQYYIISLTSVENGANGGKLFYSKIDMSMNGGAGGIVANQKSILIDSNLTEKLTGVTGSYCNIWLIARSKVAGEFKSYEVTSTSINPVPVISATGNLNPSFYLLGGLTPSPNKKAIVSANFHFSGGGLEVHQFDPATGLLSSSITLDSSVAYYSACFSPDNSKIYAVTHNLEVDQIYQFDLNAPDPAASKTLLGLGESFAKLKLASDGRVYFRSGNNSLGRIEFPNNPGLSCNFTQQAIRFNTPYISGALPNVVPFLTQDTAAFNTESHPGHCWGAPLTLYAETEGWDYSWSTGSNNVATTMDTSGVYWVTYKTAPCVFHADTFYVTFPEGELPTIFTTAECRNKQNGNAFAFTHLSDPVSYSYTWMQGMDTLSVTDTLSNVPSGTYSLHVQTDSGCDTLLFFDIPEADFRVSFDVSDTLICLGDPMQLTNTSDAHFTAYRWAFDNGDTSALSDPALYTYSESGIYQIMLSGEGTVCQDTAFRTIVVDQPFVPAFDVEPDVVCVGGPVRFSPITDSTTVQLTWDTEEQLWTENVILPQYQHAFANSGTFPITLTVQSRACPDTSYTDTIRVYPFPEVDLGTDSSLCLQGQPIYLKNLRNAPSTPYHQVWSTGDTTDILKVVHPGIYTLSVTTEPTGCTTTESIEISKDCYFDIPNAFTPNRDGHNDYFLPRQLLSEGLTRFHMQVVNRWGQVVFETQRPDGRGWDGQLNGKAQPSGVYLYRIEADFSNGRQERYEGNVTLIR